MTDAERMVLAMDGSQPLSLALGSCEQISDPSTRGDCQSAAVHSHDDGQRSHCLQITDGRWRSECIFRLAERTRESDLEAAIALCGDSDFDRDCLGHLVRDEAIARVELDPAEQAEFAAWLVQSISRSDVSELYWEEWAMARFRADIHVAREDCGGLEPPGPCVRGLRRARRRLETELGSENRCTAFSAGRAELVLSDGRPVLNSGVPGGPGVVELCGDRPE